MTIEQAFRWAQIKLQTTSDAPALDAQWLLLDLLQWPKVHQLYVEKDTSLSSKIEENYKKFIEQRKQGVPLAYLLGWAEFYGRRFKVNRNVLIPRPATENLIEEALKIIPRLSAFHKRPLIIADLGTGSGCIAITLALEARPYIQEIVATDISEQALTVAKENSQKYGPLPIQFLKCDMLSSLPHPDIDLIVSNPPYVPSNELNQPHLHAHSTTTGLQFEPGIALDGGPKGKRFTDVLRAFGKPLIMEITGGTYSIEGMP